MGVDEQIWNDSVLVEGKVFLRRNEAYDPLLTVPGGELVPQFRHAEVPHFHLGELAPVLRLRQHDRVDPTGLSVADRDAGLPPFLGRQEVGLFLQEAGRGSLTYEDVPAVHDDLWTDEAVVRRQARVG